MYRIIVSHPLHGDADLHVVMRDMRPVVESVNNGGDEMLFTDKREASDVIQSLRADASNQQVVCTVAEVPDDTE